MSVDSLEEAGEVLPAAEFVDSTAPVPRGCNKGRVAAVAGGEECAPSTELRKAESALKPVRVLEDKDFSFIEVKEPTDRQAGRFRIALQAKQWSVGQG